jgi:hypothetical protein
MLMMIDACIGSPLHEVLLLMRAAMVIVLEPCCMAADAEEGQLW